LFVQLDALLRPQAEVPDRYEYLDMPGVTN